MRREHGKHDITTNHELKIISAVGVGSGARWRASARRGRFDSEPTMPTAYKDPKSSVKSTEREQRKR